MSDRVKELEGHVASLRSAVREAIPVIDYAHTISRASAPGSNGAKMAEYLEQTSAVIRRALDETTPIEDMIGSPLEDVSELASLVSIKQNEPGIWDMGMQARLNELVERWKR